MNQRRVLSILQAPHVSEKSVKLGAQARTYIFKVIKNSNKKEIKSAVEQLLNVKVEHVRVVNVKSKPARFGQRMGRHQGWKKAYVKLVEGSEIEMAEGQS